VVKVGFLITFASLAHEVAQLQLACTLMAADRNLDTIRCGNRAKHERLRNHRCNKMVLQPGRAGLLSITGHSDATD